MERTAVPSMIREQRPNQWIEDYSDSILRTCFLYLSDQTQAEDATQDTWIKAWKHMDDFERKGIANEKAWLLHIAINTCKDYRRTAWFRHVDRSRALDELPPQLIAVEPEDRTLTLMVMDLPDRYKQVMVTVKLINALHRLVRDGVRVDMAVRVKDPAGDLFLFGFHRRNVLPMWILQIREQKRTVPIVPRVISFVTQ